MSPVGIMRLLRITVDVFAFPQSIVIYLKSSCRFFLMESVLIRLHGIHVQINLMLLKFMSVA